MLKGIPKHEITNPKKEQNRDHHKIWILVTFGELLGHEEVSAWLIIKFYFLTKVIATYMFTLGLIPKYFFKKLKMSKYHLLKIPILEPKSQRV